MGNGKVTAERLREVLRWDAGICRFVRAVGGRTGREGDVVGSYTTEGYRQIQVDKKNYREHHLVWLYFNGEFPKFQIDHINGVRDDNRPENLRDVTHKVNKQNIRKPARTNKSGFLGVSKTLYGWASYITKNGKMKNLGTFQSPEAAYAAYVAAKRIVHAEGCTI